MQTTTATKTFAKYFWTISSIARRHVNNLLFKETNSNSSVDANDSPFNRNRFVYLQFSISFLFGTFSHSHVDWHDKRCGGNETICSRENREHKYWLKQIQNYLANRFEITRNTKCHRRCNLILVCIIHYRFRWYIQNNLHKLIATTSWHAILISKIQRHLWSMEMGRNVHCRSRNVSAHCTRSI